jgi:hypothetical protein
VAPGGAHGGDAGAEGGDGIVTPDELPALLQALAAKATAAASPSVNAMALAEQRYLVTNVLVRYSHAPGTCETPSPPGQPPALVTGTLRRSVQPVLAAGGGPVADASVAPHTVYARIQEYGGHIYPVRRKFLRWFCDGHAHFAKHVYLPPRPYMKPARDDLVANGTFHREAAAAFARAVWG